MVQWHCWTRENPFYLYIILKNVKSMKKQNFIMACIAVLISCQCIAQTFSGESSVITYASGKVFSNPEKTVRIEITYDGIKVNGNLTYFNLEISVLNSSVALIKGYSLSNPDGTISFRLNSSTGCIIQGSDSYCSTSTTSSSSTPTDDNSKFIAKMPFSIHEKSRGIYPMTVATLTFERNGTAKYKGYTNDIKPCTWKVDGKKIKIYFMNGEIFSEDCSVVYTSDNKIGLLIKTTSGGYGNLGRNYEMYEE